MKEREALKNKKLPEGADEGCVFAIGLRNPLVCFFFVAFFLLIICETWLKLQQCKWMINLTRVKMK